MKRINLIATLVVVFTITTMISTSCLTKDEEHTDFGAEKELLIGKWKNGTDHQRYDNNGTGVTWDTADDVAESEGQIFEWTLEVDILTHIHVTEMSHDGTRAIPKVYTVKELTATTLSYEDDYGKLVTFTKI